MNKTNHKIFAKNIKNHNSSVEKPKKIKGFDKNKKIIGKYNMNVFVVFMLNANPFKEDDEEKKMNR